MATLGEAYATENKQLSHVVRDVERRLVGREARLLVAGEHRGCIGVITSVIAQGTELRALLLLVDPAHPSRLLNVGDPGARSYWTLESLELTGQIHPNWRRYR